MFGLKSKVHIRWMISKDIERMAEIAREEFRDFTPQDIDRLYQEKDVIGVVAEMHERVVAFVFYRLAKKYLSIRLLMVTEAARRKGIGSALVEAVIAKMNAKRRSSVIAMVQERDLTAQLFFKARGFVCVHTMKDIVDGDMYVFMYKDEPFWTSGRFTGS